MDLSNFSPYYNLFNQIVEHQSYLKVAVLTNRQDAQAVTDTVLIKDVYYGDGNLLVKYFSKNFQIILVVPHFYFKSVLSYSIENLLDSNLLSRLLKKESSQTKPVSNKKDNTGLVIPIKDRNKDRNFMDDHSPLTFSPQYELETGSGLEGKFVFSVSAITSRLKQMIVKNFYSVWVKGEVHDAKLSVNGHMFFNLRDENASLSCVVYAHQLKKLKFKIISGIVFECLGNLTLYEKRGVYQLVAEKVSPEGQGELDLAFKQLKSKLEKEGLFAWEKKKPIPKYPQRVGIITSIKGAALIDILKTTQTEFYNMDIVIFPCLVQGERAAESIKRMIEHANHEKSWGLDVLILARGGGSSEDLWAFNEEVTARAIYKSKLPIISAIGHEVDWTIADMVVDYRCPTPTAAARFICKGKKDLEQEIFLLDQSLRRNLKLIIDGIKYRIRLFPVSHFSKLLFSMVFLKKNRIIELKRRLIYAICQIISKKANQLSIINVRLDVLSPQKVFDRGYVIIKKNDLLVSNINSLDTDDLIEIVSFAKSKSARIL